MGISVWCQTDIGNKREVNQDSFLIDEELGLYVVADGMGGHRGGEVASALAVETAREVVRDYIDILSPNEVLRKAYMEASHRIYDKSQIEPEEFSGMGTTMVAFLFRNPVAYIANVGDSRVYLFCNPNMWQLTEDHSLIQEQLKLGMLKEENIAEFGSKNIITRSVGFERDVHCDILMRQVQKDDIYIMCSDGLSGLVTNEQITEICMKNITSDIVPRSIAMAKDNGGDDNVTAMVIQIE